MSDTLKPYPMPQPVIPGIPVYTGTGAGIQASQQGWVVAQDRKGPLPQPVIPTKVGIQAWPVGWIPAFAGMTHILAQVISRLAMGARRRENFRAQDRESPIPQPVIPAKAGIQER